MALWFERALTPDGWRRDVRVAVAAGVIVEINEGTEPTPGDERHWLALPGMPNLHSHAFQRAMAGLAERSDAAAGGDSFWTWREAMYRIADSIDPEALLAIAAMAYAEMLERGFTRVGEFHYLHHAPGGRAYDDPGAMAQAIAAAAAETGIGLTLLPVFYAHSDFGGTPPTQQQARFVTDLDGYGRIFEASLAAIVKLPDALLGVAPHSLRAVTREELDAIVAMFPDGPVHIHIAEQLREVEACLAWSKQRPVAWLLDHAQVDGRWCLVHATHVDGTEVQRLAASNAVAGLCPITEANLGDGIFPAADFLRSGGTFGIGSDSNVLISAAEELRLLEYGQRLAHHVRNALASDGRSTGTSLWHAAGSGGARALGSGPHGLVAGAPADIVTLRKDSIDRTGASDDQRVDGWIFATCGNAVDCVWRGGSKLVSEGRHHGREAISNRFDTAMEKLLT
jgi:formiminoglutamate deiminase